MLQVGVSAAVVGHNSMIANMMLSAPRERMLRSDWHLMSRPTWHATIPPPTAVDSLYPSPLRGLHLEPGGTQDLIQRSLKANTEVVPLDK